jgi:hypothetical protein
MAELPDGPPDVARSPSSAKPGPAVSRARAPSPSSPAPLQLLGGSHAEARVRAAQGYSLVLVPQVRAQACGVAGVRWTPRAATQHVCRRGERRLCAEGRAGTRQGALVGRVTPLPSPPRPLQSEWPSGGALAARAQVGGAALRAGLGWDGMAWPRVILHAGAIHAPERRSVGLSGG